MIQQWWIDSALGASRTDGLVPFRSKMERHVYRRIRETNTSTVPLARVLEEWQDDQSPIEPESEPEEPHLGSNESTVETVQRLINLLKGKRK